LAIDELETIVSRLDGYIDALSSIGSDAQRNTAGARKVTLDTNNIDESINALFTGYCKGFQEDFPDMTVSTFSFQKSISITNWIRVLHNELEKHLLPKDYENFIATPEALKSIKYYLAWQAMEMVRMISSDFESEIIFKSHYVTSDSRIGVLFVIPVGDACLTLRFDSVADV
jgi:hypothetical protein